jgi:hypothetical protein
MYPVSCGQAAIKGRSYTVLHWRDWHDRLTAVTVPSVIKREWDNSLNSDCVEGRQVTLKALVGMERGLVYTLKALACFEGGQAYKLNGSAWLSCMEGRVT